MGINFENKQTYLCFELQNFPLDIFLFITCLLTLKLIQKLAKVKTEKFYFNSLMEKFEEQELRCFRLMKMLKLIVKTVLI